MKINWLDVCIVGLVGGLIGHYSPNATVKWTLIILWGVGSNFLGLHVWGNL